MLKDVVFAKLISAEAEDNVKADAARLLFTGSVGASEGPGQNLLNLAVAEAICDLAKEPGNNGCPSLDQVIRACLLFEQARTQRTTHLPSAYLAAKEALDALLAAGLPSIPRSVCPELWMRAKRAKLLSEPAETEHQHVDVPFFLERPSREGEVPFLRAGKGTGAVVARREAHSKVWGLVFQIGYHDFPARGYFAVGVLSPRSVQVQAAPLSDADGNIVGVEALATVNRKDGAEYYGAEWIFSPVGAEGTSFGVFPSDVGKVIIPAFPAVQSTLVRQGDVVFARFESSYIPVGAEDPSQFERPALVARCSSDGQPLAPQCKVVPIEHLKFCPLRYSPEEARYQSRIACVDGPRIITHPDHPSVRLSAGWWAILRGSRSVRPQAID